jgi:Dna[CI] antecedent, DciA
VTTPGAGGPGGPGDAPIRRKPAWLRRRYDPYPRRRRGIDVADAIAAIVGAHGLTDELRAAALLLRWPEIVGDRVARRSKPDGFWKHVLWIRVANSAWLHELTVMKPQLLNAVRAAAGSGLEIEDLRFHLGRRQESEPGDALADIARLERERRAPPRRLPLPPPATGDALARIERETASVDDPELRDVLRAVRVRHDK